MPEFVSVLQGEGSDVVVVVSASRARSKRLTKVDLPATNALGTPYGPRRKSGRPVKPRTSVHAEAEKKKTPAANPAVTESNANGGTSASQPEEG